MDPGIIQLPLSMGEPAVFKAIPMGGTDMPEEEKELALPHPVLLGMLSLEHLLSLSKVTHT